MPETTTETPDDHRPASACKRGLASQPLSMGRTAQGDLDIEASGEEVFIQLWDEDNCYDYGYATRMLSWTEAERLRDWLNAFLAG